MTVTATSTRVPRAAAAIPRPPGRMRWQVGLLWPAGVLLAGAQAGGKLMPTPLFVLVDACYVVTAALLLRRARSASNNRHADAAGLLVVAGVSVFALASLTGIPTAEHPGAMIANTAALLLAAVLLTGGTIVVSARIWDGPGRVPAAVGLATLALGSAGYLANLVARAGVILSGAAPAQAAVEETAWQANAYLQGLPGQPSGLTLILVWLDLLQLVYVVSVHLALVAVAVALGRAGALPATFAKRVVLGGGALAAVTTAAAVLAVAGAFDVPVLSTASNTGAWTAYILTAPFMTTLLPFAVGVGLLLRGSQRTENVGPDAWVNSTANSTKPG